MVGRARVRIATAFAVVVAVAATRVFIELSVFGIPTWVREVFREHRALDAALVVAVGVVFVQLTASSTMILLRQFGRTAYIVRNVVLILGYLLLAFAVGLVLGIGGESVLASATFSGLIVGLALQPVLSNFFAGLIILLTGYVRPGQEVRIAGLPIALLTLPAYKFFSRDTAIPSIRGTIVEIGLTHTKVLDVDGNLVKVSNNMLLNSSVVLEEVEEEKRIQIRYEFPLTCDPDEVLAELHRILKKMLKSYRLYIEEQSDKQNYTVLVITTAPPKTSARAYKSAILKEIINLHRRLLLSRRCLGS